ncbi:MAG: acyl-CoA dehydratase activase [Bacteroidales bacterium]
MKPKDNLLIPEYHLGVDIGSVSVNIVVLDPQGRVIKHEYVYCQGRPFFVLKDALTSIFSEFPVENLGQLAYTGTGGKLASELTGGSFVNEIIAQSTAVSSLYPEARTIIEMGGEDSKLIFMQNGVGKESSSLSDFSMNALCAAGTGSFLDQQAKRIGVSIENEFGELALQSQSPPRIAGRCSVFAKSDMIHLQQVATPVSDIVAGLCFAVARNLKSTLARGKHIESPVLFNGGVAANKGMVRAFREVLNLSEDQLIISEYHAVMGALGAIQHALSETGEKQGFNGIQALDDYLVSEQRSGSSLEPLVASQSILNKEVHPINDAQGPLDVWLGVDVGSLSTNVVLIDKDNHVIARRYLPTASKPLEAIKRGLTEIYEEVGEKVRVVGVGTTGSGRYLTGDFIGADAIRNEITAQATAAIAYDPTVDTIFEIGGQDSKYIRIQNGVVVDFEMNKVCAAGTGSFLEEQAEKLGISIIEEFGDLAMGASNPSKLGDRCTVFMESDLNSHSQKGESIENLVGGLAYSIVHNYLNRVVGQKPVGKKIFFQGGVTNNKAVVAAFEKVTGRPMIVPPHFDVTGAIGAAMLARDAMTRTQATRFKGFDVRNRSYSTDNFICKKCNNNCEIRRVRIEGEPKPLFYGSRCDIYDVEKHKNRSTDIPNYFAERTSMLLGDYDPEVNGHRGTIGIPRALMVFYQQFPFWRTFFEELGFRVVVSSETTKTVISRSLECMVAETCYPVEVMHGHILDLYEKGVDHIFAPFIVNAKLKEDNPTSGCNCPWVQTYSFMVAAAFQDQKDMLGKIRNPVLHFRFSKVVKKELITFARQDLGVSAAACSKALVKAYAAQDQFERALSDRGKEVLSALPADRQAMVLIGRPYNSGDPAMNLDLVEKLIRMEMIPIPLDFLPLEEEYIFGDYKNMYWPNGQKILAGARIIAKHPGLNGIYIGNFRCGPDSFLQHFVHQEMKGKPYLHLEVDEHSADAGMITRIEAFADSLSGYSRQQGIERKSISHTTADAARKPRKLFFPYMNDAAHLISAACRACGLESDVLPMQTAEDIELARKYTTGTECFPMICTTGSFLKKLHEPGVDPSAVSFFMPDHNGPCRFGEYNMLQKQIFERIGFRDVEIISPSNETSYAEMPVSNPVKFRLLAWKSFVAMDLMRKMLQEKRPYEMEKGSTNKVYQKYLTLMTRDVERGARNLSTLLEKAADEFDAVPKIQGERKPVVAVVGEIFMRDNAYCSARLVERLEELGAETLIMPTSEWLLYSTYRYIRDSKWRGSMKGLFKAQIQKISQHYTANRVSSRVINRVDKKGVTHLDEILNSCNPYIHKDYDGDPALSFGNASILAESHISGVANILPFTCMPGTVIASVSEVFRKDHSHIPWLNIAYDGQEDTALESRLQAFMFQARQFSAKHHQKV